MLDRRRRNEVVVRAAAFAALVAGGLAASPAVAITRTEKTFGSWDVVCVEDDKQPKRCSMLQSRVTADKKQVVLVWSISSDAKKELRQALTVPAGVSIKEGVRLFLGDGEPATIAYDLCGPRVCIATAPVDSKFVGTVKASKKASASYVQASRQLVQTNLDLDGFAEAYDYLVQQLS